MKLSLEIVSEMFSKTKKAVSEDVNRQTNLLNGVTKDNVKSLSEDIVVIKKIKENAKKIKRNTYDKIKYFENTKATKQEIEKLLELVEDDVVKNYVQKELQSIACNSDLGILHYETLENLRTLVDGVNSFNGKYSVLAGNYEYSYLKELGKFIKENKMEKLYDKENFRKDIELEEKFYSIKEYLIKNTNSPMSEYLYDQYYLKYLEKLSNVRDIRNEYMKNMFPDDELKNYLPEIIKKLREINSEYGVKVFLDNTAITNDAKDGVKAMENLAKEFSKWKTAGQDSTVFPPVLDTLSAKADYFDKLVAYGGGVAAGESLPMKKGSIIINSIKHLLDESDRTVRHEMIHTNDNKYKTILYGIPMVFLDIVIHLLGLNKKTVTNALGTDANLLLKFIADSIKDGKLDVVKGNPIDVGIFDKKPSKSFKNIIKNIVPKSKKDKHKRKEDSILYKVLLKHMENAGISTNHIPYGFNNMFEFIAVCGEGDMTKYPKWFKAILRACGMPKRVFKLDNPGN